MLYLTFSMAANCNIPTMAFTLYDSVTVAGTVWCASSLAKEACSTRVFHA